MLRKFFNFLLYRLLGWRLEGELPREQKKLLMVFLPHTSNWDFFIGLMFMIAEGVQIRIFAKDQFYFFPLTYCYKALNIVPIKRDESTNFVQQAAQSYASRDELWSIITPEGTRSRVQQLRSGYYYLAKEANVPILLIGPDFKNKKFVIGPFRHVEDSFEADVVLLHEFSKSMHGKNENLAIN